MDAIKLENIFTMAQEREREANVFYTKVAGSTENRDVKEVFEQLAKEELGHFDLLGRLKVDPSLATKFQAPPDYKVAEATDLPSLSTITAPKDAIALAMKKEQQAVEFYRGLGATTDDLELKDIFENLATMELGHKSRLETVFVDIGYPEVF